jgi:hypothetical protein
MSETNESIPGYNAEFTTPRLQDKLELLTAALQSIEPDPFMAALVVTLLVKQTIDQGALNACDVMEALTAVPTSLN